MYVVIEGPDGCGKTSVATALASQFENCRFVREPSGPIRKFLLDDPSSVELPHFAKALLFAASSYAHARETGFVVSDRWAPVSSRIYQALDEGAAAERESIASFWNSYVDNLKQSKIARPPTLLIYLRVDAHTAYHRATERKVQDNMDNLDFSVTQRRVAAYDTLFKEPPYGIPSLTFDASRPIEVTANEIANSVVLLMSDAALRQAGGTRVEL